MISQENWLRTLNRAFEESNATEGISLRTFIYLSAKSSAHFAVVVRRSSTASRNLYIETLLKVDLYLGKAFRHP